MLCLRGLRGLSRMVKDDQRRSTQLRDARASTGASGRFQVCYWLTGYDIYADLTRTPILYLGHASLPSFHLPRLLQHYLFFSLSLCHIRSPQVKSTTAAPPLLCLWHYSTFALLAGPSAGAGQPLLVSTCIHTVVAPISEPTSLQTESKQTHSAPINFFLAPNLSLTSFYVTLTTRLYISFCDLANPRPENGRSWKRTRPRGWPPRAWRSS